MNKRVFFIVAALLLTIPASGGQVRAEKMPVLLDCDTANEIDDLYAIVRGVVEPEFKIVGLRQRTRSNRARSLTRSCCG